MAKPIVNENLVALVDSLMQKATSAKSALTLDEKLSIVDRALKLEMLKAKVQDEGYGSGFDEE